MDRLAAGTVLCGRYEISKDFLICRFSTLYHATDVRSGTPVVIRLLRLPPFGDEQRRADMQVQIVREGARLADLQHPNLPAVLDMAEDSERYLLVLEHFDGRTLDLFLKDVGALPARALCELLQQFLQVMEYLHSLDPPIIHRDLRPHSVVLTTDGVLKIAEFGLARINEPGEAAGVTLFRAEGSSNYAAPEQLARSPSSPANDIYAVGCIMYFLVTHQHPPKSMDRVMTETPLLSLRDANPEVSAELDGIIRRMMEPARGKRYETAREVMADLARIF